MPQEHSDYASYLLRLWKSNELGHATWRASLESMSEGRRYNFAHVEDLITFLLERFGPPPTAREVFEDERSRHT
jgi:hypothetical protein